nr:MAG TPA: hypothetical protein [Caudoviricetes sp.]
MCVCLLTCTRICAAWVRLPGKAWARSSVTRLIGCLTTRTNNVMVTLAVRNQQVTRRAEARR